MSLTTQNSANKFSATFSQNVRDLRRQANPSHNLRYTCAAKRTLLTKCVGLAPLSEPFSQFVRHLRLQASPSHNLQGTCADKHKYQNRKKLTNNLKEVLWQKI